MAKIINTAAKNSLVKNKSFALLRTNPKLTSNIKLVADSSGDIYLSSIKASRTLSQVEFQKYPLSDFGQYNRDVALFYGKLPKDKRYQVGREHTDLAVSADFSSQYENLYNYGASFNYTKAYDEQYRMLAPIWLEDKVPSKFIIYRIEDVNFSKKYTEDADGQNSRIQEMLSKATIIKSFDLTNNSKLGAYLNSHIEDPLFPSSHLSFNFEIDEPTHFSGIDAMIGGFVNKMDYIDDDYIREDLPEILANNTITSSFERNGIISANVMNIEFLFDDEEASDYNIYRYFGIYADEHEEGSVLVENVNKFGVLNLIDDGSDSLAIIPNESESNLPILSWVKDNEDNYHHIKNSFESSNLSFGERFISTSFNGNADRFTSKKENDIETPFVSKTAFNGFMKFLLTQPPVHNDKIFLGDLLEISIERFNLGDFIFIADETMPIGTYSEGRYSCQGNTSQIASALAGAIRNGEIIPYSAQSYRNSIVIDDYSQGRNKYTTIFGINTSNPYTFLDMGDCILADSHFSKRYNEFVNEGGVVSGGLSIGDYSIYTMSGGCAIDQGIVVSSRDVGNINVGDYVKYDRKDKFTRIIEIIRDPLNSKEFRVIFEKPIKFSRSVFSTYNPYKTPFGKFSAYDFKDFDFDFYSTINSDVTHLEFESENYKEDESSFSVSSANSTEIISPNNALYSSTYVTNAWVIVIYGIHVAEFIKKGDFLKSAVDGEYVKVLNVKSYPANTTGYISDISTRLILSGEPNSEYTILSSDINNASEFIFIPGDENLDLFQFKKLANVIEDDSSEGDSSEIEITSEYDRLNENSLKETSINSRVVPTICKFALKEGTAMNSRNLPYILNANEAFGIDNLSADISIINDRDSDKLNMEHFLIWNIPSYLRDSNKIPYLRDYINPTDEKMSYSDISSKLKDVDYDYFSAFLNFTGASDLNGDWIDAITKRLYTSFTSGDSLSFSSTVFKGLRYIYKERKEFSLNQPISFSASSEINDYKYSTVLCYTDTPAATQEQETVVSESRADFEFIKNDKFKTITLLIHLTIPANEITEFDRYLSYTLTDIKDAGTGEIIDSSVRGFLEFGGQGSTGASSWEEDTKLLTASIASVGNNQPKFTEDIFKIDGEYAYLKFNIPGYSASQQFGIKVVSVVDDNNIIVSGTPGAVQTNDDGSIYLSFNLSSTDASNISNSIALSYDRGGRSGWENVLKDVVAPGMAERINSNSNITYTTISEEGVESTGLYTIEIQDGVEFIKTSILTAETDDDKPKAFKLSNNEIGHDLVAREDGGYYTNLRRMNGEYNPLFRSVIEFTAPYRSKKLEDSLPSFESDEEMDEFEWEQSKYNNLSEVNCVFASYLKIDNMFGIIPNFFYHKVNEEGSDVLKLSQETDKQPLYPLIGEIAIDKKNLNLFNSKYAKDYYTRSYEGGKNIKVNGTLSPIEERSFFASTIMKVKNQYDITAYNTSRVFSLRDLDVIRYDEKENTNTVYIFEDRNKVYMDFYIVESIVKELKEDNIVGHYGKYVNAVNSYGDKTTIEDDVSVYAKENIIPRFILDEILVYGFETAGEKEYSKLNNVMHVEDIMSDGHIPLTNFEISRFSEKPLDFRLIYNKKPGYNYSFRVHSKIIA
jgi:hypothetical protein